MTAASLLLTSLLVVPATQDGIPEIRSVVTACGVMPPRTFAEWKTRADLVVRVRIDASTAFEHPAGGEPRHIVTAHETTVLELFKGHPRAVAAAGASQQVLQWGGRLRTPDAIRTQTWNSLPPFPVGSEWVLFLEWKGALNGFMPLLIEHGAIPIVDGKVAKVTALPGSWRDKTVEDLAQAIRSPEQHVAEPWLDLRVGAPDPGQWRAVQDAKDWRNPYLIVHADRVELISQSRRRSLRSDQVRQALADLPLDAWPYGRIIAVQEAAFGSPGPDDPSAVANLREVLAVAQGLKVSVSRWPH